MNLSAYLSQQVWTGKGLAARLLWPLTLVSRLWLACNHLAYKFGLKQSIHLPVPVLVVGNVLAGGTGKTPIVIALVEHFQSLGWRVGVIARAYRAREEGINEVVHHSNPVHVGDEPLLIRQRCGVPVFVGRERALAARALLSAYPDTQLIISDDGMQHRKLHHDVSVCVFDDRGLGNGWLLPAGPLRELWPRGESRVRQFNVHTGEKPFDHSHAAVRRLSVLARNGMGEERELASWRGHHVQALAAIARPALFFESLKTAGLVLINAQALPDHADLSHWQPLGEWPVFCTEKDAVKLWPHFPAAWAVPLDCMLPAELLAQLTAELQRLSSLHGQKTS
jgi:tetraacyldisaccharide 4'-kinase